MENTLIELCHSYICPVIQARTIKHCLFVYEISFLYPVQNMTMFLVASQPIRVSYMAPPWTYSVLNKTEKGFHKNILMYGQSLEFATKIREHFKTI